MSTPKKEPKSADQVIPPQAINPAFKAKRRPPTVDTASMIQGILDGDRVALGQAITLVESTQAKHQELAQSIIQGCLPHAGKSFRMGITGPPGVGKSTFIEGYGNYLLQQGHRVAVLAVDPSSQVSKGSILGDKTRMETLSVQKNAFIRPSPAGTSLGGVAQKTRETILLCEAAGFDQILIETVGVGQSEIAVHSMVDFFTLLLLPGAGDELQGIKRGVVEMADLLVVNKADGERVKLARTTRKAYRNAIHLFPAKANNWTVRVETCSALENEGLDRVHQASQQFQQLVRQNGHFEQKRQQQASYWLHEALRIRLLDHFFQHPAVASILAQQEALVVQQQQSPFLAAEKILEAYWTQNRKE